MAPALPVVLEGRVAQQVAEVAQQRFFARLFPLVPLGERLQCPASTPPSRSAPGPAASWPDTPLAIWSTRAIRKVRCAEPRSPAKGLKHSGLSRSMATYSPLVDLAQGVVGSPAVEDDHRRAQRQHLLDKMVHQEGLAGARLAGHDGVRRRAGVEQVAGDGLAPAVGVELPPASGCRCSRRTGARGAPPPATRFSGCVVAGGPLGYLRLRPRGSDCRNNWCPRMSSGRNSRPRRRPDCVSTEHGGGHRAVGPSPQHQVHAGMQNGRTWCPS